MTVVSMAVVVPIKAGTQVKSRLADQLSPQERRGLGLAMAADVLSALSAVPALNRRHVVTGDDEVTALAAEFGFIVMPEPEPVGYRSAAQSAMAELAADGIDAVLCMPADLPLLQADDVQALIDAVPGTPSVVLAPSRNEDGTNAIVLAPPDLLDLQFGPDSYRIHARAAAAMGCAPIIVRRPNLALDIDTPDDLRRLIGQGATGRTRAYLEQSGIMRRMDSCGARNRKSG